MKTSSITLIALALILGTFIATQVEAQGRRGARRPSVATAAADQDDATLEEPQPAGRRRNQGASRSRFADEEPAEDGGLAAPSSSLDDSGDSQDYQPRASRAGPRRRYQDQDLEDRPVRRRQSRKNNRRNNGNNLNFNGLPDGFPSAAFGAGFGAAVSGGGRGRGPSNAAGFGAGFAQSGSGNALAGGFGSGLVNSGFGGNSRGYDDDDDSDYDSGR